MKSYTFKTMKKLETMIDALITAGVIWHNDRDRALSNLSAGKSWSTGIKGDKAIWDKAVAVAEKHGFAAEVDDSASSIDFVLRPSNMLSEIENGGAK